MNASVRKIDSDRRERILNGINATIPIDCEVQWFEKKSDAREYFRAKSNGEIPRPDLVPRRGIAVGEYWPWWSWNRRLNIQTEDGRIISRAFKDCFWGLDIIEAAQCIPPYARS